MSFLLSCLLADVKKEFLIARPAVLQGQMDLMAFQSASICPDGEQGGLMNSQNVLFFLLS